MTTHGRTKQEQSLTTKIRHIYFSKAFLWCLVCIGIILHSSQYIFNRSLWVDEATLALNILARPYLELLKPLASNQAAPIGFLIVEKFLTHILGDSEYVLRLIPFLSALLALVIFLNIAPYFIKPFAVPVSMGLFAVSGLLVYHSSTLKQYSSDVLITLLLYMIIIKILSNPLTLSRVLGLGGIGAAIIWFSHPAIFVLTGVGGYFLFYWLLKREWVKILRIAPAYLLWIASFVTLYIISLRYATDNEYLKQFWSGGFMPLPPTTLTDILWFINKFFEILGYALEFSPPLFGALASVGRIFASVLGLTPSMGFSLAEIGRTFLSNIAWVSLYLIAAFMLLAGCISIAVRDRKTFYLLVSPVFFTLLASGIHKYPFENRLILFLVPIVFLLLGEGAAWIRAKSKAMSPLMGLIVIGIVCFYSGSLASYRLIYPRTHEEARPVLRYLKEHKQDGDGIYVYYASQAVFRYYSRRLGFGDENWIQGIKSRENWNKYIEDLQQLRGNKRIWLFFSHAYSEEAFFLYYLDSIGKRLDSFKDVRASVYLYDLS